MGPGDRQECVLTIETNKLLEIHENIVGNSCSILSIVAPSFSGVISVLNGYVVNPIFCVYLMIFLKVLTRDSCYGLEFSTTGLKEMEQF